MLDRGKMEQAAGDAKKVGFDSEEVKKLNELLAMPEDKFVELQLKKAVELKDPVRVVNREIRLRGIYLQKHGAMFEPHKYPKLRSPPAGRAGASSTSGWRVRCARFCRQARHRAIYFSSANLATDSNPGTRRARLASSSACSRRERR